MTMATGRGRGERGRLSIVEEWVGVSRRVFGSGVYKANEDAV